MIHKDITDWKTYKAQIRATTFNNFLLIKTQTSEDRLIELAYAYANAVNNGEPTEGINTLIKDAFTTLKENTQNFLDRTITHQSATKIIENGKEHTQGFDPADRYGN